MPDQTRIVHPGPVHRTVRTAEGEVLKIPEGWEKLEPGDAGLTRRVKAAGPTWTTNEKKGRRTFSLGVWADAKIIAAERAGIEAERETPAYARKRATAAASREKAQDAYVEDFVGEVRRFLGFAPLHDTLAGRLAAAIAAHATPVGSGTVARTKRIPIEERAEAAVIAWLRHQTTAYDSMQIPRVKGKRREVRRMLAQRSRLLLDRYRRAETVAEDGCPIRAALNKAA